MTGFGNRRAFDEAMRHTLARAYRECRPLAIVLADLNDLKEWNNAFGHEVGDRAIRALARVMRSIRADDECFKLGDRADEFAALLHITRKDGQPVDLAFAHEAVRTVVERMIDALERPRVVAEGSQYPVSASFGGIVVVPDVTTTPPDVMRATDKLVYRAKKLKSVPSKPWRPRCNSAGLVEIFHPASLRN